MACALHAVSHALWPLRPICRLSGPDTPVARSGGQRGHLAKIVHRAIMMGVSTIGSSRASTIRLSPGRRPSAPRHVWGTTPGQACPLHRPVASCRLSYTLGHADVPLWRACKGGWPLAESPWSRSTGGRGERGIPQRTLCPNRAPAGGARGNPVERSKYVESAILREYRRLNVVDAPNAV